MAPTIEDVVKKLEKLPHDKKAIVTRSRRGIYRVDIENNLPYIDLEVVDSDIEYNILHIPRKHIGFFPGYRRQFVLETDIKPFVMHLTGANLGSVVGDEYGGYLCHPRHTEVETRFLEQCPDADKRVDGSFKRFYEAHPEIGIGDRLRILKESNRLYRLIFPP